MKRIKELRCYTRVRSTRPLIAGLVLAGFASAAFAQPTTQPTQVQAQQTAATQPVVELSPFQVSSERDEGFMSASAVAGGRLAIDLKDAPVAYSVLNKEFLDALQITGLEQAADWAPNSTRVPDHGHENTWGGSVLVQTRGISSFFAQRDFFPMQMDFDSYNMDRIDFGRGPNAVLFGFASFGGTQNVVTKQARLDSTFTETRLTYGSWDKRRATLDHNMPVSENFGLRLNILAQDDNGWRDGEFNKRYAAHLAAKWRLGRNTELRGELERGYTEIATPYHTYYDQILGWNGSTVYNTRQHNPAGAAAAGVQSLGNFNNNTSYFVYSPTHTNQYIGDFMGMGRTTGVTGSSNIGGMPYVGTNNFAGNQATMIEQNNMPANRYDLAIANSNFTLPDIDDRFGLTNDPLSWRNYEIASIFLTHQINNLYFELAANYSHNKRGAYHHILDSLDIYLDINQFMPDGSPNPMFLEPYGEARIRSRKDNWRNRNLRFSAAYVLDDTRFGSYTFQAMVGATYTHRVYVAGEYKALRGLETADWGLNSERIYMRRYLNEPAQNIMDNLPTNISYIDNMGVQRDAGAGWLPGHNLENREVEFMQASIRARWFDGRLIGIVSARIDDMIRQGNRSANNRDLVGTNWDPSKSQFLPKLSTAELNALTYVPKDINGNATGPALLATSVPRDSQGFRLPQYANDRFQTDYAPAPLEGRPTSIFAGAVYHFTPAVSLAVNLSQGTDYNDHGMRYDGSPMPARDAVGQDVSLRLSLLEGRLNTNFTYYQGEEENEAFAAANLNIARWDSFNTILSSNALGDLSENGINGRGIPLLIGGGSDRRTRENSGFEFEAVANITRNWRMIFNFALPKAHQLDTAPDFRNYFDASQSQLRQVLADSGIIIDSNDFATLDTSVDPALRAPNNEHQNVATAWNNAVADRRGIVVEAQELGRSMKFLGNIYTDYQFTSGPLQNFKIGGGINYRGKAVVGYKGNDTIVDPSDSTQAIDDPTVGPLDTVTTDSYLTAVLNFGYNWRYSDKLNLMFDFKINNLFDNQDAIYTTVTMKPPGGDLSSPARIAVPGQNFWRMAPRSYTLAVTARF